MINANQLSIGNFFAQCKNHQNINMKKIKSQFQFRSTRKSSYLIRRILLYFGYHLAQTTSKCILGFAIASVEHLLVHQTIAIDGSSVLGKQLETRIGLCCSFGEKMTNYLTTHLSCMHICSRILNSSQPPGCRKG